MGQRPPGCAEMPVPHPPACHRELDAARVSGCVSASGDITTQAFLEPAVTGWGVRWPQALGEQWWEGHDRRVPSTIRSALCRPPRQSLGAPLGEVSALTPTLQARERGLRWWDGLLEAHSW